jgi:hypothetical protein
MTYYQFEYRFSRRARLTVSLVNHINQNLALVCEDNMRLRHCFVALKHLKDAAVEEASTNEI